MEKARCQGDARAMLGMIRDDRNDRVIGIIGIIEGIIEHKGPQSDRSQTCFTPDLHQLW
jgi:hypothetical protein